MCRICLAVFRPARRVEDVERNIRQAIAGHLQVMREVGEAIPEPSTGLLTRALLFAIK